MNDIVCRVILSPPPEVGETMAKHFVREYSTTKIEVDRLSIEYEDQKKKLLALKDVSFCVEEGEFLLSIRSRNSYQRI